VLCLWIFADILRHNLSTTNVAITELAVCGVVDTAPNIPEGKIETYAIGKTIFKNYCASCHNKNMKDDMTGPALGGVEKRWADYPREDLYGWIRNSQQLVSEEHPRAISLVKEWDNIVMSPFPNLTDEEIEGVLLYVETFK
jgi:mono/diheme cytochrome c family protein